ncbi:nuclear transport factor 2 family protein [Terriglobus roseus]|uniref:Ketosteroid isomerase-related protein n=1 Tax=Terriglobus roseus TaxID=392734 RepID=A0A1G7L017_9BACT|nr:nuclear transport factor 2 family protein [Terriglobus roseus]SDF42783.1 Ketosteroid isomerase-related protein [Terriglobus roseus]
MAETNELLRQAYAAFNRRDVDGALELMTPDVRWPKASEGGFVVGKDEIRAYWKRQWQEFDPNVEPVEMIEREDGSVHVRVHQVVKSLYGDLLFNGEVVHVFTLHDGLISAMELGDGVSSAPSRAFTHSS